MNRTRGFLNLNRFKSGRVIKRLVKITDDWHRLKIGARKRGGKK